ncbi:MAG TPA: adenylyltransferase/cytidyltransferase family protein [Candidatus Saccharimonadales bacterium]|nr:adenylyltransferase/cytidyltransferase family protein [Candidatus Saccharimonadales bacterium]
MIITEADLQAIRTKHRAQRLVLAGGTYDLLHAEHIQHLTFAREQGDVLVVMLANDIEVHRRKGADRPVMSQSQRAQVIDALKAVDYTLVRETAAENGSEELMADIANALQPDVFVLYHETPPAVLQTIRERIGAIKLVLDMHPRGESTTEIVARIRAGQSAVKE